MSKERASDTEQIYYVEKILKKKIQDNKPLYLVKWMGFSSNHNSWEPAENFQNSQWLLGEFERKEIETKVIKQESDKRHNDNSNDDEPMKKKKKVLVDTQPNDQPGPSDSRNGMTSAATAVIEPHPLVIKGITNLNPTNNMTSAATAVIEPHPVVVKGITNLNPTNDIMFVIQLSNGKDKVFSRQEAHKMCPHMVIEYYEKHIVFIDNEYETLSDS